MGSAQPRSGTNTAMTANRMWTLKTFLPERPGGVVAAAVWSLARPVSGYHPVALDESPVAQVVLLERRQLRASR
jgi:hypothetical protein